MRSVNVVPEVPDTVPKAGLVRVGQALAVHMGATLLVQAPVGWQDETAVPLSVKPGLQA